MTTDWYVIVRGDTVWCGLAPVLAHYEHQWQSRTGRHPITPVLLPTPELPEAFVPFPKDAEVIHLSEL